MSSRDPPWMTPLVKSLLRKKAKLINRNINASVNLKIKIDKIIRENRKALSSGTLGSRGWWRKVDQLTLRKYKNSASLDDEFVEGLNNYFGNLCFDSNYVDPALVDQCSDYIPQLSTRQVYRALSGIKCTATGPDNIPFWVWKDYSPFLTDVVEFVWNLSLSSQSWPNVWKEANVKPLPKVAVPAVYQDFRGISVTPVIARTFERTVYNVFNKTPVESYVSESQFAYRSGGSCINALLMMQHNFWKALDKSNTKAVRLFTNEFSFRRE